jgi:hypothetical protein
MLTGFIFIFVLFLLILAKYIKTKKIKSNDIFPFLVVFIALIFANFWPLYDWWNIFINSSPIQTGIPPTANYSYSFIFDSLSLYGFGAIIFVFGILHLLKHRSIFLLLWTVGFLVISFSFISPYRPPSYWRFVPYIKIPIIIGFSGWLIKYSKHQAKNIMIFIATLGITIMLVTGFSNSIIPLIEKADASKKYEFLQPLEAENNGKVILTYDPLDSYVIQAITYFSVVMVPWDHSGNILLWPLLEERRRVIENAYERNNSSSWAEIIKQYNVNYVLLDKRSIKYNYDEIKKVLDGKTVVIDDYFELIEVN